MKILCLGDSYTIGELVETEHNFPNKLKQLLLQKNIAVSELQIIAKTGDTTFELQQKIDAIKPHNNFDVLTLLIGVNNQYRNLGLEDYYVDFEKLLQQAIAFAQGQTNKVIVLSIPDWGVTPFNTKRNAAAISVAIDAFNFTNKLLAKKYNCTYINITEYTRQFAKDAHYLATDLLHYSQHQYAIWAQLIANELV